MSIMNVMSDWESNEQKQQAKMSIMVADSYLNVQSNSSTSQT